MPSIAHLCRDCLEDFDSPQQVSRCPNCASSRVLAHSELRQLAISHIDCDAFFASVEKRDNPSLLDKPVIIGGEKRGVVSTCCYIARMDGVHSAMPMFTAKKKCPNAVIIRGRMSEYVKVSRQIREKMNALSPLVEPLSIDEAFVDLNGTEALHKSYPAKTLARFANEVEKDIGVSVSIGLSHNKFLAKIASDLDKPRGMALIGKEETIEFLAAKPISIIYGVGKVFTATLKKDGFVNISQLQNHDPDDLARRYGDMGYRLARLSKGQDQRALVAPSKAKSISNETTFFTDISSLDALSGKLLALCEQVSERMKKKNVVAHTVTVKLKTANFKSRTRAKHLSLPTQLAHVMYETAFHLLQKETDGTKFRLIGVGMSSFDQHGAQGINDPVDMLEPKVARNAAAERAMDKVRDKFGREAVVRGKLYRQKRRKESTNSNKANTKKDAP